MDTRNSLYIDNLIREVDSIELLSPIDIARVSSLYIRIFNDSSSIVNNVSISYIRSYDGKRMYRNRQRFFDQVYELFLRNGLGVDDKRKVLKMVARRCARVPTSANGMRYFVQIVIEETNSWLKSKKTLEKRLELVNKFKMAIKKYLNLTYSLGFNEPSSCVNYLIERHKIDKYIMSGDFSLMLLPFMPKVEDCIRKNYEHYEMTDSWEMMKGRYFNHIEQYRNMALEIKSAFPRNISNFSDYFDTIYTDTYYKLMLGKKKA